MTPSAPRFQPRLSGLLAEASRAYRRRDDETFLECLLEATDLAPERLDLRECLASHYIQTGNADRALAVYESVFRLFPGDAGTLFRLAHWRRFFDDTRGAEEMRCRLFDVRPDQAADLMRIWTRLDAWFSLPVADSVPAFPESVRRPAILTLGYVLFPDGSPQPELIARLEKTLDAAERHPDAYLVVSGGMPRSGRIEAVVMREWLEAKGIPPERIGEEGYSRDVVENLEYSRSVLSLYNADAVMVITSAGNVRRAGAALEIMAGMRGDGWTVQAVASSTARFKDDGEDRLKAYRDALRAYGMPMMNAYPELIER